MKDIIFSTATELARAIRKKQVSAVEVLNAHLAQIARYNSALNAIVTLDAEGARQRAQAADTVVVHYTVNSPSDTCHLTGFFQPVDNWPTENTLKAGAGVPIKFRLGGNMGLSVLAAGSPTSRQVSCPSGSAITADAIEETTTSNSGLTYDAASTFRYGRRIKPGSTPAG